MKNLFKIFAISMLAQLFSCADDDAINEVQADFMSNITSITEGENISFTDRSSGDPISWKWTFDGGNPSTSIEQNPTVLYSTQGTYDVSLMVTNSNTNDTKIISGYIVVAVRDIPEEFDIVGTWERVESNYSPLDGMQVTVYKDESEGEIIESPSSAYTVGDLKWKNIDKLSEHEYVIDDRFTDGSYEETALFILAYGNELIIGNFNDSDAGSFQRWKRVDFQYPEDEDYSLTGIWDRTKSNHPPLDGMIVEVDINQTQGIITETPDSDDFPIGAIKWNDIQKEGANRFVFDDLVSNGTLGEARLFIVGKGSEVIIGAFSTNYGSFQRWTRE